MTDPLVAPRLSVAVLNYNYAKYLPKCLESILGQTVVELEVVVVDDASSDRSLEVIDRYRADPRVRVIDHTVNQGFSRSLLEATESSATDYLAVVSADDWLSDSDALSDMIRVMDERPGVGFVFGAFGHYFDEGSPASVSRFGSESWTRDGVAAFESFQSQGIPLHSGAVLRREAYEAVGGYDPELRYALDVQIFYELCTVAQVAYVDRELVAWRRHGGSMSSSFGGVRDTIEEVRAIIDAMAPSESGGGDTTRWLRAMRSARARALTMYASDAAFNSQPLSAIRLLAVGVAVSPIEALLQRNTLVVALRVILGRALFDSLAERVGRRGLPASDTGRTSPSPRGVGPAARSR